MTLRMTRAEPYGMNQLMVERLNEASQCKSEIEGHEIKETSSKRPDPREILSYG
jgi:hypothetical protein